MRIAFFGLGNMGFPIAANLLKHGHAVTTAVHRNPDSALRFQALGGMVAASPAQAVEGAELIFTIVPEDTALLEQALNIADTLLVWNKSDLNCAEAPIGFLSPDCPHRLRCVSISAKTGEGLDELESALKELAPLDLGSGSYGELLTNQRQEDAARRALDSVVRAREALDMGVTPDALLTDVEQALSCVGELTGQSVREDITDRIFSKFCVGK